MKTNETPARPTKLQRDAIRRDEIVSAAKLCVVQHGFHAASMAQIATQAKMSVGQIYRYFPNKDAIVTAIVERIVAEKLAWIASTGGHHDLAKMLANRMLGAEDADDRALLLEVTAEATRNPHVAGIVRKADRKLHAQAVKTVRQDHPGLNDKQISARVEFMAVLYEGTAFRRVTDQLADARELASLYRKVIDLLLPSAAEASTAGARAK